MAWTIALLLVFAGGLAAAVCVELEKERGAEREFKALLDQLAEDVSDPLLRQAFLFAIRQPRFARVSKKLRSAAYETALVYLLANSSQVSARSFVVEVGRWHFGAVTAEFHRHHGRRAKNSKRHPAPLPHDGAFLRRPIRLDGIMLNASWRHAIDRATLRHVHICRSSIR